MEFVEFVSNISVRVGLRLDLCCSVDRIRVVLESDSYSLVLLYNVGVPHNATYDDLIAAGAQGEPAACAGDQGGRCSGIRWEVRL